ncbi:LbtU family siderophore porin [Parasphingorhabdus sp.]|jgi:hypothetical protein|uniref:LbtU family siderophore porin n=1 Tax=Parasphingorhabdus sp. TaxID=2709688 RepID=UPI0007F53D4D|nr:hypothetical protein A8B75_11420 [Sphingomonadales bacterium EhC05]
MKSLYYKAILSLPLLALTSPAIAQDRSGNLEERVAKLEAMNARLIAMLEANQSNETGYNSAQFEADGPARLPYSAAAPPPPPPPPTAETDRRSYAAESRELSRDRSGGLIGTSSEYSYKMLDHAENVNTKPLLILEAKQMAQLDDRVTISGGVTVLANYQKTNRDSKFAWLMRHPTSANQIGETASEIVVHSAQAAVTAKLTPSLTAYAEMLYNPEQSFGQGTITALNRNQVQVRKAFILWGNLDKRPVYIAAGKMDVPFGLNDTVSPFTNSTNWHAFAPLAYAGTLGYFGNGLHLRATAIQGGAQFRAANSPVEGTSTPSRVNNFAVDGNYTLSLDNGLSMMAGGSYIHGSTYCQSYPVFHFNPCADNVPAWAAYGTINFGGLKLLGEFASTTRVLPGSAVPDPTNPLSAFAASKVSALTVGGRYSLPFERMPVDLSLEFSNFTAGDDGAPWERQNQWVVGASHYIVSNVNLFGEFVRTEGYVPLNFLSGGNFPDGSTWSDRDARSSIFNVGIQAAF